MNYTKLSAEFSVAAQIAPVDIEFFAREGFTTVICNRPDGEAAGQAVLRYGRPANNTESTST